MTLVDAVKAHGPSGARRAALEAQAEVVRARLREELGALRDRRRALFANPAALEATGTAAVLGLAALGVTAGAAFLTYRLTTRKERLLRARIDAWARLLRHPERVAPARGLAGRLLEHAATAALTAAAAATAKHYAEHLLEAPPHDIRVAPSGQANGVP